VLVGQLLGVIDRLAPSHLAEEWDNVGLIVGRHNQPVRKLLVALELRDEIMVEADQGQFDGILVHHPPIFPSITAVTDDQPAAELVLRAAEIRTAIIAAHTNLDAAPGGLNDVMAGLLEISGTSPLAPHPEDPAAGLGRIGHVAPRSVAELAAEVGSVFAAPATFSGDAWTAVRTLACCTGSGAGLIGDARAGGADAYVTSDLKYHDADRALGLPLIGVPHAAVEQLALKEWSRSLARTLSSEGAEVAFAETTTDPWQRT
jgi:dinuclear metal center YbgI/SA1388 family protein